MSTASFLSAASGTGLLGEPDDEETPEARVARYRNMYDVDTLAQMCVDAEESYSKTYDELALLKAKKKQRAKKLTAGQIRALAHVAEMSAHVEAHNARWPRDKQPVGAHSGTRHLPYRMAQRLVDVGLAVVVEGWPAQSRHGLVALTDAGRNVLRSTHPISPEKP